MVVFFVSRFKKDLKSAPHIVQKKVFEVIGKLEVAENLEKSGLDCRKMEGQKSHEHYYRIRIGDWRMALNTFTPALPFYVF